MMVTSSASTRSFNMPVEDTAVRRNNRAASRITSTGSPFNATRRNQCTRKLLALGSADFRPLQREQANDFGIFNQSRGAGDIEAP